MTLTEESGAYYLVLRTDDGITAIQKLIVIRYPEKRSFSHATVLPPPAFTAAHQPAKQALKKTTYLPSSPGIFKYLLVVFDSAKPP
jgi:hypothetical protein